MSGILWGAVLGVGLALGISPWLWPARERSAGRRRDPLQPLRERLAQAGFAGRSPAAVIVVSVVLGVAAGFLVLGLVPVVVLAAVAALAAAAAPFAAIVARARARRRAMRAVWPDAIDQLVAALRSGAPLGDAMCALGDGGPIPLRPAFADFAGDYRATASLVIALDELKVRLSDPIADRVIETVRVAREVGGGELPSVLRALAAHLRADAAIRSEVEARQTWAVSAARLGVAAPWLVLLLLASRPEAAQAYNSPVGAAVLATGAVVTIVAYRIMLAIGRLSAERRLFA